MMPVDLHFELFNSNYSRDLSESIVILWLRAMAASNLAYLREHPETSGPYSGKIAYILEVDTQHWLPIPQLHQLRDVHDADGNVVQRAGGDCKDLSTYVVAWYYFLGERLQQEAVRRLARGEPADRVIRMARILKSVKIDLVPSNSGFFKYHVRCRWPNGRIEDPSIKLGMNRNGLREIPQR